MIWESIAYTAITAGFASLIAAAYFLHRICVRLSAGHPDTYRRLGEPTIATPVTWPSRPLREFLASREYASLEDPQLDVLCMRLRTVNFLLAFSGSVAFVSVFAEAYTRAA